MAKRGRKDEDHALVLRLASGDRIDEAAKACGVSERTVYRRLEDPDFVNLLNAARKAFVRRAADLFASLCDKHIRNLDQMATDGEVNHATRRGCSRDILDLGPKYRSEATLEERVTALEQAAARHGHGKG